MLFNRANNHVFILVPGRFNYNSCECHLWNHFSIYLEIFCVEYCDKQPNFMIEIHHAEITRQN